MSSKNKNINLSKSLYCSGVLCPKMVWLQRNKPEEAVSSTNESVLENGNKVGYSVPGIFGGRDFYDADGKPAGYSVDSVICGENFYDEHGTQTGYSVPGVFGGNNYYDADGKPAGWSTDALFGGENIRMNDDLFSSRNSSDPNDFNSFGDPPDYERF